MIQNKKALSTVVTTLIIILLVLVAVGVIWVVVRDVIEGGAEQIDISTKCLEVDVRATAVVNIAGTDYDVTLKRGAGGDAVGGVMITIFNNTDNSGVIDISTALAELQTSTESVTATNIADANKIETTVYFTDASGNAQLCSQTNTFSF